MRAISRKNTDIPVIFSGIPPTKTVLHPLGLSRVVGWGAFGLGGCNVQLLKTKICFTEPIKNKKSFIYDWFFKSKNIPIDKLAAVDWSLATIGNCAIEVFVGICDDIIPYCVAKICCIFPSKKETKINALFINS